MHFLFARWAGHHWRFFVDEWGRPFFTLLYAVPAVWGYRVAKLTTVAICLATAWQTWKLAAVEGLERAPLAIPFLWLQPSYLLLSSDTMTEPLFALLLVTALLLRRTGQLAISAVLISCAALTRPEGFVLAPLWALWLVLDPRAGRVWWRRLPAVALLAFAPVVLGLITWVWSRDPLWVWHHWPINWSASAAYGKGSPLDYFRWRREITGPLLQVPFAVGVVAALMRRRLRFELAIVAIFFLVHSVLWSVGAFGSAGYPRYFVCVAPPIALLILLGWNELANAARSLLRAPWPSGGDTGDGGRPRGIGHLRGMLCRRMGLVARRVDRGFRCRLVALTFAARASRRCQPGLRMHSLRLRSRGWHRLASRSLPADLR